jgi:hypothetical protein
LKGISVLVMVKAKMKPTNEPKVAVNTPIIRLLKNAVRRCHEEKTFNNTSRVNSPLGNTLTIITLDKGYSIKSTNETKIRTMIVSSMGSRVSNFICWSLFFIYSSILKGGAFGYHQQAPLSSL